MTDTNIPTIENLIRVCRGAEDSFAAAAEAATDPELKQAFGEYAQQRLQFARDLHGEGVIFGDKDPTDSRTVGGSTRHAWLDVRDTLDDRTILAQCEGAEHDTVEAYRAALESAGLADCLRDTVAAQLAEVRAVHRRVRDWRDRFAPAG